MSATQSGFVVTMVLYDWSIAKIICAGETFKVRRKHMRNVNKNTLRPYM